MKANLILAALLISLVQQCSANERQLSGAMRASDRIVWVGIDYSMVKFMGTSNALRVPDLLFQDMAAKWNELFLDERLEGVASALGKRIDIDIASVTERNKGLSRAQVELYGQSREPIRETHITAEAIKEAVAAIKLSTNAGIGLLFIADRLVAEKGLQPMALRMQGNTPPSYLARAGAVYVIFFDIASREVLSAKREVRSIATGGSFRNLWFGPIKDVDSGLGIYRD